MENNKFTLHQTTFNYLAAIEEAFSLVNHYAVKKDIKLQRPDLPECMDEYFQNMYGDKRRHIQVLVNFLANAIKFSKPGGPISVILKAQQLQFASESSNQSISSQNLRIGGSRVESKDVKDE